MSTNHTPNYNLCQWEETDRVMREDFNADNRKIDAALAALRSELAHRPKIFFGSYTGDGMSSRTITLGYTPKAVLLFTSGGQTFFVTDQTGYYTGGFAFEGHPCTGNAGTVLDICDGGFQVSFIPSGQSVSFTNSTQQGYYYIAFV